MVIFKVEYVNSVVQVKRGSDRVMSLKLQIKGVMLNVVCMPTGRMVARRES